MMNERAQAPVWAELIVALGIIAVIVTMFVPVMSGLESQGADVVNGSEYEAEAIRGQQFGIDTFVASPAIALGLVFVFGITIAVVSSRI